MKIACGTVLFRQYPLEMALNAIREIGYEYIETNAGYPWCLHVDVDNSSPVKFADQVKSFGFKGTTAIWMSHGSILLDDLCVEYAARTLEWAKAAGIPIVNIGEGYKLAEQSNEDAFKLYEERMLRIIEAAEKNKVHIAIEPHGTFSVTCAGLNRLLSISSSEWFGINYDGCNIYRAAHSDNHSDGAVEDEVVTLQSVMSRVIHMHAKDFKDGKCTPLGKGNVRVAECIDVMKNFGYDGVVSLETEGDEDFDTTYMYAKESFEFLKNHCN